DGKDASLRRDKDGAVVSLPLPGVYRPVGSGKEQPASFFVATLDPKESDLRRVDESELKAQRGGAGSAQVAATSEAAQGAPGTPLWSALLLLGALALLGEGALTRR